MRRCRFGPKWRSTGGNHSLRMRCCISWSPGLRVALRPVWLSSQVIEFTQLFIFWLRSAFSLVLVRPACHLTARRVRGVGRRRSSRTRPAEFSPSGVSGRTGRLAAGLGARPRPPNDWRRRLFARGELRESGEAGPREGRPSSNWTLWSAAVPASRQRFSIASPCVGFKPVLLLFQVIEFTKLSTFWLCFAFPLVLVPPSCYSRLGEFEESHGGEHHERSGAPFPIGRTFDIIDDTGFTCLLASFRIFVIRLRDGWLAAFALPRSLSEHWR